MSAELEGTRLWKSGELCGEPVPVSRRGLPRLHTASFSLSGNVEIYAVIIVDTRGRVQIQVLQWHFASFVFIQNPKGSTDHSVILHFFLMFVSEYQSSRLS